MVPASLWRIGESDARLRGEPGFREGRAKGSRLQAVGAGIKDLFAQWIAGYCVYREGQGI